jgi:hypothetical protein
VLIKASSTIGGSSDPWSNATWDVLKGSSSVSLYTNVSFTPNGVADKGSSTFAYTAPTRNTTADETHYGNPYFAGSVGIGTNSPAYPLHVVGSGSVIVDVDGSNQYTSFTVNNTIGRQASINLAQSGSQAWAFGTDFAGAGTADFFLYQSGGMRNPLYIDAAGNVRVGGTSGFAGTHAMTILQGGNVGIGTAAPGQKLDVAGGYIRSDTGFLYQFKLLHLALVKSPDHVGRPALRGIRWWGRAAARKHLYNAVLPEERGYRQRGTGSNAHADSVLRPVWIAGQQPAFYRVESGYDRERRHGADCGDTRVQRAFSYDH